MSNPQQTAVQAALSQYHGVAGALLPVLHHIQNQLGFIPDSAVPTIAHELNLSNAQVHGVISFYHYFRTSAPTGKPVVEVCVAEACQARGANQLMAACRSHPHIEVEPIYCLGQCATGPSVLINGVLKARMNPAKLADCLEAL